MLVMLAFGFSGFVWFKASFDKKIDDLKHNELAFINRRIDGLEVSIRNELASINRRIDDLKNNDFAHLNSTIEALTYALEKNAPLREKTRSTWIEGLLIKG
jgi:hypothetical protein